MSRTAPDEYVVQHDRASGCPACGGTEVRPLIRQPAGPHLPIQRVFDILQCGACKLAWVLNVPTAEELGRVYDEHFFSSSQQSVAVTESGEFTEAAQDWPIYINSQRRVEEILRRRPSGRLIDVGCGKGVFLKLASRHFEVTGLDLSESAARYAREVFGLNVIQGDFQQAALPEGHFDVATLWDVLGSLAEPSPCVEQLARLLKPGGLLVMTVPDIDTLAFRVLRRYWPLLIPPINLCYFSRPSLEAMFERCGLRLESYSHPGKLLSGNFVLRKLGRITGIRRLDRPDIRLPLIRNLYLNLGDIGLVYAVKV